MHYVMLYNSTRHNKLHGLNTTSGFKLVEANKQNFTPFKSMKWLNTKWWRKNNVEKKVINVYIGMVRE